MTETPMARWRAQIGCTQRSNWLMVDQAMIDDFARLTKDHELIHVDPVAAAKTPLGSTIAHGFLLLSLLSQLREWDVSSGTKDVKMGLNYGFDRIRFTQPVLSGSRVRGAFTLRSVTQKKPGQFQHETDVILEIEDSARPALIATWITQFFT